MDFQESSLLSVIVPSRNEERSIHEALCQLRTQLPAAELLVVDASQDRTPEIVETFCSKDLGCRLFHQEGRSGKGAAIRLGIEESTLPYIAQFDSDLQFEAADLKRMLHRIHSNPSIDFICGSRFLKGAKRGPDSIPGPRFMGNKLVNAYISGVGLKKYTDTLSGIKVWRREVTESFELVSDDFCYEVELPLKATRNGFIVEDFPVTTNARKAGQSSVPVFRTALKIFRHSPSFAWFRQ